MADELSLYNAALAHLGEERQLDDLEADPGSREQRVFRGLLPTLRDAMLRKHPWLCAESRLTVTRQPLTARSDWKFANVFLLPPDTLRVWQVDTDLPFQRGPYVDRNPDGSVLARRKALFCDAGGPLDLTVIERVAYEHLDEALFDAMGYELAARAAGPLQADKALQRSLQSDAREALAMAVTIETSEFRDDVVTPRGRFLSSRGGDCG